MRHYFLEWSLCHTFAHISCGLFVKESVIPQQCELGGTGDGCFEALSPSSPPPVHTLSEDVGCLRTCFRLLVLSREVQLI